MNHKGQTMIIRMVIEIVYLLLGVEESFLFDLFSSDSSRFFSWEFVRETIRRWATILDQVIWNFDEKDFENFGALPLPTAKDKSDRLPNDTSRNP